MTAAPPPPPDHWGGADWIWIAILTALAFAAAAIWGQS